MDVVRIAALKRGVQCPQTQALDAWQIISRAVQGAAAAAAKNAGLAWRGAVFPQQVGARHQAQLGRLHGRHGHIGGALCLAALRAVAHGDFEIGRAHV